MKILLKDIPESDITHILPTWCTFNGVTAEEVAVQQINEVVGKGIVASRDLDGNTHNEEQGSKNGVVLRVPESCVLSCAMIDEYALVEPKFKDLMDAFAPQSTREKFTLFLTLQHICNRADLKLVPTPYGTYTPFLPQFLSTPTLWPTSYLPLLAGTELAPALTAKLHSLSNDFERFRKAWENSILSVYLPDIKFSKNESEGTINPSIWNLADAWYRSRVLEIPGLGDVMVPMLDMANHDSKPNAFWDHDKESGEVLLIIREGLKVKKGDQISINYGSDRSATERLFAYGMFNLDEAVRPLIVPVTGGPLDTDPLINAKRSVFKERPMAKIVFPEDLESWDDLNSGWDCPFGYLVSLNAEDGLEFKIVRSVDGTEELRMFLDRNDITSRARDGRELLEGNPIAPIIEFRILELLKGLLAANMERIAENFDASQHEQLWEGKDYEYLLAAQYAYTEAHLLQTAFEYLNNQTFELGHDPIVKRYLEVIGSRSEVSPKEVAKLLYATQESPSGRDGGDPSVEREADDEDFS